MFKFSVFIVVFIVVYNFSSNAQSRVEKLTDYLVDTNASQTEQAKAIYNWITANIIYDVKAFEKFDNSQKSVDDILSSRKGICYDYANLFSLMCNSAGIESYVINGYCKNQLYYKRKPFLRSNHSWNVFYADSAWHIVDATWGSGYVSYKPDFASRTAHTLFRAPYCNNKSFFVPEQDFTYFDIQPDTLTKSHYPLDAKWLFSKTPISYNYFETDSAPKHSTNEFFVNDIQEIRSKSYSYIYQSDAIKGISINKHNFFDLANSYWNISENYDIERSVSESNLWQFEKYSSDYGIILQSISRHKAITDSVYRYRVKSLKTLSGTQKRMTGKIKTKTKSAQKSFRSGKQQILGKNSSYRKKQETFMINIGKAELKRLSKTVGQDSVKIDIEEIALLEQEIKILEEQKDNYVISSDSLMNSIGVHIKDDAKFDDSIFAENKKFNLNIVSLNDLILTGNEAEIRLYVDSLSYIYGEISYLLEQKKGTKSKLQETSKLYYTQTSGYQKILKDQIGLLEKVYKLSNYSDTILNLHEKFVSNLIGSYKQNIDFTQKIANHGLMQKDIRKENLMALRQQKKNIVRENRYFQKWFNHLYSWELANYNNEKELVKTIKTDSQRNQKMVETKLKKYKDSKSK
jgi:hypothetical protein